MTNHPTNRLTNAFTQVQLEKKAHCSTVFHPKTCLFANRSNYKAQMLNIAECNSKFAYHSLITRGCVLTSKYALTIIVTLIVELLFHAILSSAMN